MNLKDLLGDAYKEGMTHEEIDAALDSADLLTRAEAETLANSKNAATQRLLNTANKKLAEEKQRNTAAGNENADLLARITTLENAAKESERNASIAQNKAALIAQGYDDALASETATAMADGDMAKIILNQGKFINAQKQAFQEAQVKNTKDPVGGGNGSGTFDFAKAKDEAIAAGDTAKYMALCRQEMEQAKK